MLHGGSNNISNRSWPETSLHESCIPRLRDMSHGGTAEIETSLIQRQQVDGHMLRVVAVGSGFVLRTLRPFTA